ncbi:MAG: hypothetical protein IKR86_01605 [Candidatus Methanomethylophilaceae archaeon]|nr:hypothetical protein [Candidatus Methanomethylophilaceae archaeon]
MNKEEILLKNYAILSKNIIKNKGAVQSAITQLLEVNPEAGLDVWERSLRDNMTELSQEMGGDEFPFDGLGFFLVTTLENDLLKNESFGQVAERFADNDFLVDVLFRKSPVTEYSGAEYVVSYLIRNSKLDGAGKILSALYANEKFAFYSSLWEQIISGFQYGESYCPGFFFGEETEQPEEVKDFCVSWIEKIEDEEQQAAAMTFAMKLY